MMEGLDRRSLLFRSAALGGIALLGGCGRAAGDTVLRASVTGKGEADVALLLRTAGLRPNGFAVDYSNFQSGQLVLEALNGGSLDYGGMSEIPPIFAAAYNGIRGVDVRLLDAARSFGLDRREQILHVILPGALPSLLVGFRYALSISVVMLVIAEQINASAGLGYLVNNARDFVRTDIIVVCLMVYAILGLSADLLGRMIETRALAWRPSLVGA